MTTHRVEPCVCGGPPIKSPSLKDAGIHVAVHNAHPVHISWRRIRQAQVEHEYERAILLEDELWPNRVPRPWPTAGDNPRDLSGSKAGASTGVEGAA